MATKPKIVTLTNASVDILNVIRNNASVNYQNYVPVATADTESIREIGAILMDYPSLQNEFLNSLVNRIGRVIVTSKSYQNPWAMFKKGMLDFGESIEEIFVNIAKPYTYDANVAESNVFKREIPDVRSTFHVLNYQKFYKATVQQRDLQKAFMSLDGVVDLINKIIDAMYTASNYDEFQTMKYLLAKHIMNGRMYPVTVPTVNATNAKEITSTIKAVSNNFEFLSHKYNVAGVENNSLKESQYLLINSNFDAIMDVEVLASAFNMDKAEFMGKRVLVDGFGELDIARLNELFAGDNTYTEFTAEELSALNAIPCVIVDENWFMIFDNMMEFTEQYNGEGLYWNYWYHVWKTFSVSPYANNALFVPGTPSVESITVSPSTASISAGQSITLSATVATEYFAPQSVNWSVNVEGVTVSAGGLVTVDSSVESGTEIVVTATSTYDSSVTGTATLTVA